MRTLFSSRPSIVVVAALIGMQNGVQITLTRWLADQVPPATLALGRYMVAFVLLAPLALLITRFRPKPRDLAMIGTLGILNFGAMIAIQNLALHHLPAGRGALIFASFPFFTLLFSATLGFERLDRAKLVGVVMTVMGVAVALGDRPMAPFSARILWLGEGLMLISALLAALCSTLYRPYVRRYPALAVSATAILCANLALMPVAWFEAPTAALLVLPPTGWLAIATLGAMSALFYWAWLWTLGRLAPGLVTIFHALAPISAAATGALALGEPIGAGFVAGVVTVLAGFVVAFWPDRGLRSAAQSRTLR